MRTPVAIAGSTNASEVATAGYGGLFPAPFYVYVWGEHYDTTNSKTVQPESNNAGYVNLVARGSLRCAIDYQGITNCWGYQGYQDYNGLLGGNNTKASFLSMGWRLVLAINSGALWEWGVPLGGQNPVSPQRVFGFDP